MAALNHVQPKSLCDVDMSQQELTLSILLSDCCDCLLVSRNNTLVADYLLPQQKQKKTLRRTCKLVLYSSRCLSFPLAVEMHVKKNGGTHLASLPVSCPVIFIFSSLQASPACLSVRAAYLVLILVGLLQWLLLAIIKALPSNLNGNARQGMWCLL